MNKNNLIFTDTKAMNREQWLAFRQPLTHVKPFLAKIYEQRTGVKANLTFFSGWNNEELYKILLVLFTTEQWKEFIFPTVGASEISSIVGLNPYKSIIELYYEKIGLKEPFKETNAAMFWGKTLEATIAEMWQYWDGSAESVFENEQAGKIVRRCRRLNAYTQNKNWPWLFVSVDRIINKGEHGEEGVLECKTMSGHAADMWEDGIPPMYVAQLQTCLAVTELKFGEMANLIDGREFSVYPFGVSEAITDRLIRESKKFFDMVKAGVENYLLYCYAPTDWQKQEHIAKIDANSPEPDGSLSYENYLKTTYKENGYEITGGQVEIHIAKSHDYFNEKIKMLTDLKRLCSNKLKGFMKDAAVISFGEEGKVSWKADKNGTRTMRIKVNAEIDFVPDPEILKTDPEQVQEAVGIERPF